MDGGGCPGCKDRYDQVGAVIVNRFDEPGQHDFDRGPIHDPAHRPVPPKLREVKAVVHGVMDSRLRNTKFPTAEGPPPSIGMQSTILLSTPYGNSAAAHASASVSCPAPNLPERNRARVTVTGTLRPTRRACSAARPCRWRSSAIGPRASAARRDDPGGDCTSASWSKTIPPGPIPARTRRATLLESGSSHSLPQADHSTRRR